MSALPTQSEQVGNVRRNRDANQSNLCVIFTPSRKFGKNLLEGSHFPLEVALHGRFMYETRDADVSLLIYTNNYSHSLKVVDIRVATFVSSSKLNAPITSLLRKLRERQDILRQNIPSASLAATTDVTHDSAKFVDKICHSSCVSPFNYVYKLILRLLRIS